MYENLSVIVDENCKESQKTILPKPLLSMKNCTLDENCWEFRKTVLAKAERVATRGRAGLGGTGGSGLKIHWYS